MKNKDITIYSAIEFMKFVTKYEGKLIDFGFEKDDQLPTYNNVPYVEFIPNGRSKSIRLFKRFDPYIVLINGIGHIEPNDTWESAHISLLLNDDHSSFNSKWLNDFDSILDNYIASKNPEILLDARLTKGFSSINWN